MTDEKEKKEITSIKPVVVPPQEGVFHTKKYKPQLENPEVLMYDRDYTLTTDPVKALCKKVGSEFFVKTNKGRAVEWDFSPGPRPNASFTRVDEDTYKAYTAYLLTKHAGNLVATNAFITNRGFA